MRISYWSSDVCSSDLEDLHVGPEPTLLVDHPEAQAGELAVEIDEHVVDGRAHRVDDLLTRRVRAQRCRDANPHRSARRPLDAVDLRQVRGEVRPRGDRTRDGGGTRV